MKKGIKSLLCATAMVVTLTGCSGGDTKDEPRTLVVSTWGLSEDIVKRDVTTPFEEKFNCKITYELAGTNDRLTKLINNPDSTVDVIELSQAAAADGYGKDLFTKFDASKASNVANLIKPAGDLQSTSGYGPAYTINSIGIVYDREAVGFEIKDWSDLWNPALKGKISIPEISTTFGPAMVHVASDYKNVDIKSDNGEAAFEALAELKPNIVKTYTKSSDLGNMFAAGEISVAVVGDFGVPTIKQASDKVEYVVPASGTYANFNTMDVTKNSKNADLAYEYINWRLSSELQTTTATSLNEAPTNAKVELSAEAAQNKTYGDVAEKAKTLDYTFVNPLLKDWTDKWNRTLNN